MASTSQAKNADEVNLRSNPDIIDMDIFEQVLEMDEDVNDPEFSRGIVSDFFEQARGTLADMSKQLETKDLKALSELGHFLKGSSSTLGLIKLQRSCEAIQNYGKGLDASGNTSQPDQKKSLDSIRKQRDICAVELDEARRVFSRFYHMDMG